MKKGDANAPVTLGRDRSKKAYGVFAGSKWGIFSNLITACIAADTFGGEIRFMSWAGYVEAAPWDRPTFYQCSEPLPVKRAKVAP